MSSAKSEQIFFSDDSDEEDLLSIRKRLSKSGNQLTSQPKTGATRSSDPAPTNLEEEGEGEDPDWVRDFSQPNDDQEGRRRALTSVYDGDDDSLVDLTSDKEEPVEVEVDVKTEIEPGADGGDADKKPTTKAKPRVPTMPQDTLPLVFAPKLEESLVLIQGDDDALDLSGDVGAVGRVKIDDGELLLDIKGVLYSTQSYPTNTMCMVSVAEDEARVTAVLDQAVILTTERNILASEEVVAGTLDEDDNIFSADNFSDGDDGANDKGVGGKTGKATKAAQSRTKKAPAARKPKAKATGTRAPRKTITKTARNKMPK